MFDSIAMSRRVCLAQLVQGLNFFSVLEWLGLTFSFFDGFSASTGMCFIVTIVCLALHDIVYVDLTHFYLVTSFEAFHRTIFSIKNRQYRKYDLKLSNVLSSLSSVRI